MVGPANPEHYLQPVSWWDLQTLNITSNPCHGGTCKPRTLPPTRVMVGPANTEHYLHPLSLHFHVATPEALHDLNMILSRPSSRSFVFLTTFQVGCAYFMVQRKLGLHSAIYRSIIGLRSPLHSGGLAYLTSEKNLVAGVWRDEIDTASLEPCMEICLFQGTQSNKLTLHRDTKFVASSGGHARSWRRVTSHGFPT